MRIVRDPSWNFYSQTLLEFHLPDILTVDLRRQVSVRTKKAFVGAGLSHPFAVLTACNPRGCSIDASANAGKTADLEQDLRVRGAVALPADGVSPDGKHREPGFAVGMSLDEATRLARRYDQSAFFWFDGERFWIMPALVRTDPIYLPKAVPE